MGEIRMTVERAIAYARCTEVEGDLRVIANRFQCSAMRLADEVERLTDDVERLKQLILMRND